jgi:hypothetical protein
MAANMYFPGMELDIEQGLPLARRAVAEKFPWKRLFSPVIKRGRCAPRLGAHRLNLLG